MQGLKPSPIYARYGTAEADALIQTWPSGFGVLLSALSYYLLRSRTCSEVKP
jgi:hypothetical protein